MHKSLLFLSFIFLSFYLQAQTTLTNRQVYDFDINDEFHTRVLNAPPNANRYKIIGKRISANNDTVVYTRLYNNYGATVVYSPQPHLVYNFSTGTDSVRYTQLDSTIAYKTWPTDSCSSFTDTLYFSATWCGVEVYEYTGATGLCFEEQTENNIFGKGLGWVEHHYTYPAMSSDTQWNLFYYKKAVSGTTCGTADTLAAGVQENAAVAKEITIMPNPAHSLAKVNIGKTGGQEFTVSLLDLTGKVLWTRPESNSDFNLDLTDMGEGMYFLRVSGAGKSFTRKVVVER